MLHRSCRSGLAPPGLPAALCRPVVQPAPAPCCRWPGAYGLGNVGCRPVPASVLQALSAWHVEHMAVKALKITIRYRRGGRYLNGLYLFVFNGLSEANFKVNAVRLPESVGSGTPLNPEKQFGKSRSHRCAQTALICMDMCLCCHPAPGPHRRRTAYAKQKLLRAACCFDRNQLLYAPLKLTWETDLGNRNGYLLGYGQFSGSECEQPAGHEAHVRNIDGNGECVLACFSAVANEDDAGVVLI